MKYSKQLILSLLLVLGFGTALETHADDFTYNANNYTAMVMGIDKVRFTLPTGNTYRTNDGVQEGYVQIEVDGGSREVLFEWKCDNYSQVDDGCKIKAYKEGTFTLTGKVKDGDKSFTNADGFVSYKLNSNDDNSDHYTTTVDWTVPYSLRGRNLKLYVWAHVNWSSGGDWHVPDASSSKLLQDWDCPAAPDVSINMNEPMLSYDRTQMNKTMITYNVSAASLKWLKIHYTDAITNQTYVQDLPTKSIMGNAYLPADRPWKNVYMTARVVDTENHEVDIPAPDQSAWMTVKMLHNPKSLTATLTTGGKAVVSWSVDEPTQQDISDGDFFEVQRNIMGETAADDPYWTTVSMEIPFEQGKKDYSFTDETIMDQYKGHRVAYRIRRSSTAMWSWGPGSGYQMVLPPSILKLPQITNASVQRAGVWDDENHKVRFTFDFGAERDSKGRKFIKTAAEWEEFKKSYPTAEQRAQNGVFVIMDAAGWGTFRNIVDDEPAVNALLGTDITVTTPMDRTFSGVLDGCGYTLTFNCLDNNSLNYRAPFLNVRNATIRNLKVAGTLTTNGLFAGGIVGRVEANSTVTIENCQVLSTLTLTKSGDTSSGGFIGNMDRGSTASFKNCAFHGSIAGASCNNNGGFVGVAVQNTTVSFEHCVFDPESLHSDQGNCRNFVRADPTAKLTFDDCCYHTATFGIDNPGTKSTEGVSAEQLLAAYGKGWIPFGESVAPAIQLVDDQNAVIVWDPKARLQLRVNMAGEDSSYSTIVDLSENEDALQKHDFEYNLTKKCVEYDFDLIILKNNSPMGIYGTSVDGVYPDSFETKVKKVEQDELASYRFMNLARFDSLTTEKRQSSVALKWGMSGGESDYYRVLRRIHTSNPQAAWTDTIADNLQQDFWEDKNVKVQQAYDYMVESVTQCEGLHIVRSEVKNGECEPTAMICGYVRMADGTAMAGVTVIIEPRDNTSKSLNDAQYTVVTNEEGYFELKGLKYRGEGTFNVHVPTTGKAFTGGGEVTFNTDNNMLADYNFYQDQYVVYSGNIYYSETSIPVPGVSFKLDGQPMYDANRKPIETDSQGAFELSIPNGQHSVQAVKEGHVFADNGFLMNPDNVEDRTIYNFTKNVASIFIWDSTTVVLRGRVVGGDIEGGKPLGASLSRNNLGDSLRIVMQLEGDNTSWLIRDPKDETVKSKSYTVPFGQVDAQGKYADLTSVSVTRHAITISPDKKTGEYELRLHPARYKVVEVSAQGYPTLFQQGKVGETVDLAFSHDGDTCEYSRIYHSVPTLEITQFNPGNEKYYGVKKLKAADNVGNEEWMNLVYFEKSYPDGDTTKEPTDSIARYSFGHPVFMAGSPYGWMLQACEKYYRNNKPSAEPDIVRLNGGEVTIKNYLIGTNETDLTQTIKLDEEGGASYIFTPQNTTFLLDNDNALKTVSITLNYDGNYYDVKPFGGETMRGFVMATRPKTDGQKVALAGIPLLFDILRDPPGSGSSSYIEAGSKFSYGYSADVSAALGFKVNASTGTGADTYHGIVAAPEGQGQTGGTLKSYKTDETFNIALQVNYGQSWNYSYSMDATERIQTKTGSKWVGGKADLFIGLTESILLQDAMAVRVIPESMYQIVALHEGGTYKAYNKDGTAAKVKVPVGTMKVLAKGTDDKGKTIYLVRDEVVQMSSGIKSSFVHSQSYIENELLPDLMKLRNAKLLASSVTEAAAKKLANEQKKPVYVSNVDPSHDRFGLDYTVVYPDGDEKYADEVSALNQEMAEWVQILAKNEEEKLSASLPTNLVKRYDFDGGMSSIQYSESFSTVAQDSRYLRYPVLNGLGNIAAVAGPLGPFFNALDKLIKAEQGEVSTAEGYGTDDNEHRNVVNIYFYGEKITIKRGIIASANFADKSNMSETHSKKTGFTLSAASKSSLTVDVYRTATSYTISEGMGEFWDLTLDMLDNVRKGKLGSNMVNYVPDNPKVYSNFVFRTVGGVTCQPYEGERVTKWYQPGTVLDQATVAADKLRIWIDEPVQSNVPFDQPARFKLNIANETDYPEKATLIFNYFLPGGSNPKGARICVDGAPLTGSGANIVLYPAVDSKTGKVNVFTKEITVYPSEDFDYENLAISIMDPEDSQRVFTTNFSAHFIPSAGSIKVTAPSDHWVVNTESPYDGKRKAWYMPVRIEGFNVNGRGFDHVELQYKLTTQGEKDWVSVCSYYADKELRKKASGVTDTIPENGIIVAQFYGETDPVEQNYDLRAVVYARHAGGFLTNASPILTGIKDTRLPVPFGLPEPTDGILDIGESIKIKFSEPIASNYLSKINNFEVLGTPLNSDIVTSTSLYFNGDTYASPLGSRNLMGKSFTVDVMVNPDADKGDMTVFIHGDGEKGLCFGLTADRHLSATVNGTTVVSDSIVRFNNMLQQVAYSLEQGKDEMTVRFFHGSKPIGTKTIKGMYDKSTEFCIGVGADEADTFKGSMLEFRLWNRAMSGSELNEYAGKTLSGYESGLINYYRLNEGEGSLSYDRASGSMDLVLVNHSWKRPSGMSLKLDGKEGVLLDTNQKFNRNGNHDYTLMFWFKTDNSNGTLLSNGHALKGQDGQLNIGLKGKRLYVRSAGYENFVAEVTNEWHHFAMTVSRSRNVANVYLDKKLVETFPADSLSGFQGQYIALGATYDREGMADAVTGNIDEVGLFENVLPTNMLMQYANHSPVGTMKTLLFYLNFSHSEHLDNNQMYLMPSGVSLKRYVDSQGKVLERRDTLLTAAGEGVFDRTVYAPMNDEAQLENLKYSYVVKGNDLLIDIEEPDFLIEKTNVYVTVRDIPDLQGNLMASPVSMDLYVYRNPLRWSVKKIEQTVDYGVGLKYEVKVVNLSGKVQDFYIEDLPVWITASKTTGTVKALDEETIVLEVSPYINIGTYYEQITLMGDNNMSEPLPVTLKVRGNEPEWAVSDAIRKYNQSMMMVARVKINGIVASSPEDMLAVFDEKNQILGVANIEVDDTGNANDALAYLTIYGYNNDDGSKPKLNFKFFKAAAGTICTLQPADSTVYTFQKDAMLGTASEPIVLVNITGSVQQMQLKEGWNWVTIAVEPENKTVTVGQFLNNATAWEPGDIITSVNGTKVQQWIYREVSSPQKNGQRVYKWDKEDQPMDIHRTQMYRIYSNSDKTAYFEGWTSYGDSIFVSNGWNRIAYLSTINLPVAQALSGYTEQASAGDIIKSQDAFAVATQTQNGIVWKGSLQYMEQGKGYMLKRVADSQAVFTYPNYWFDTRYSGSSNAPALRRHFTNNTASTMNMVAAVEGVRTEEGDVLAVYRGGERLAECQADEEGTFYVNIGCDTESDETLTFTLERGDEVVAAKKSRIPYVENNVVGSPDQPTVIDFATVESADFNDGGWYTVSGIKLAGQPTVTGTYIHNGKVKFIKK
ncbi:MAG: hypothetical protein IJ163_08790 [Bacteroidaceae bacterium]|nr:hypothetical protein [Bacteroidaceae bacterium]